MSTTQKSKKGRSKAPKSHPKSTATISQAPADDASLLSATSCFSANGTLFALVTPVVDKHRLRVYDALTNKTIAEYLVPSARVSSLAWAKLNTSEDSPATPADAPPSKKKRKKGASGPVDTPASSAIDVVALGLVDGSVSLFSPSHGRVVRTLSDPSCTSPVLALSPAADGSLWASGADGEIHIWNPQKNQIAGNWKSDRIPLTALCTRPGTADVEVLAASHSIRALSSTSDDEPQKPVQTAAFTGHATPIQILRWDVSQEPPTRFVSVAERDRIVSMWELPPTGAEGRMVASVPLDADARNAAFSAARHMLAVDTAGKIYVYDIPEHLPGTSASTLSPRTRIHPPTSTASVQVLEACFGPQPGQICVARLVGGVRPVLSVINYLDEASDFVADTVMDDVDPELVGEMTSTATQKRYGESAGVAVRSGQELGQDEDVDGAPEGELDVDLAEASLGERLAAPPPESESDSDSPDSLNKPVSSSKKTKRNADITIVPAASLTRTLVQALHSADARLLETCLAHSDAGLIRNSVRRLPPQLAVPLINACVERLGRGGRAGNAKGGGGGASAQRGSALVTWIRTALAVHGGHLMTIPDLVARLAGLHATLTQRLALHDSLLALSGRLDLVLSQIEMRSAPAPAPLAPRGKAKTAGKKAEVARYVEGESEDEDARMDVEVEVGDDEGDVEEVALGGDSDEEDDDEDEESDGESGEDEDEDEDEDDDDESDEGPAMNGFIDDEAEEYSEEDDESE
ncbi:WD40-repeat-containing domain protein [Schizophyllum amplum]|uniref:WD40-repeat-containing domain protein n=1 Tax=Schizophyllum amplum TaxID=97359 RepID=A0A550CC74_9AGAR|nr:WD40-repeat-containing domain protein [Auriculariopsis ampla]